MKPIFIIIFPEHTEREDYLWSHEKIQQQLEDYHVLSVIGSSNEYDFKCFNAEFDNIEFEELKKILISQLK